MAYRKALPYNPISLVGTQIDVNGNIINGVTVPPPSSYQYDWEDISKANSGRTEDLEMHKNRIGRVVSITLSWDKISIQNCSQVLRIFNPEYVYLKYLDALTGSFITCGFYTGNVSAPLFNTEIGKWESVSFKLTTRRNAL